MAKKSTSGVNRSQAIRDYMKANKGAKPKAIKEGLKAQGLDVSIALINNVRQIDKKKTGVSTPPTGAKRGPKPGASKVGRPSKRGKKGAEMVSLDGLAAAKRLVDDVGGIEEAKLVIEALSRLTG